MRSNRGIAMTVFDNCKKIALTAVMVAGLSLGLSLPASATLIGDTITITTTANIPVDTWTDNVLVGAGVELVGGDASNHSNTFQGQNFTALFPGDSIDVGANSITFVYAALGAPSFPYAFIVDFSGLDWLPIAGTLQNVVVAGGDVGLVGSNISLIMASSFQFQGSVDLANGANFTLDLTATHGVPIPEPAALPLFAAGLMGLMYCLRRRREV